jgi:hypothetical protein
VPRLQREARVAGLLRAYGDRGALN